MHAFMAVVWLVFGAVVFIIEFRANRPIGPAAYAGLILSGIWTATA